MRTNKLDQLIHQMENYLECWKQFNHFVNVGRSKEVPSRAPASFVAETSRTELVVLGAGVNLPNVIHLFRARYARIANDDAVALAAANAVGRTGTTALSVLTLPCSPCQ